MFWYSELGDALDRSRQIDGVRWLQIYQGTLSLGTTGERYWVPIPAVVVEGAGFYTEIGFCKLLTPNLGLMAPFFSLANL